MTEATSTPTVANVAVCEATDIQAPVATATASAGADSPPTSEGVDVVACRTDNGLVLQTDLGILIDAAGRTGYITSN